MATDDDTGWTDVLLDGWGPLVRDAVVARVERHYVGSRAELVRVMRAPDHARYTWTEHLHRVVLTAIQIETGADLEELGSQAAWACYEDVWERLRARWHEGGAMRAVDPSDDDDVLLLLGLLPMAGAAAAGCDVGVSPFEPLVLEGRILLDAEGLLKWVATDLSIPDAVREVVDDLLAFVGV